MSAKKRTVETETLFRRGTGGPGGTPLKEYAKPGKAGDFGRDLIERLTGPGLNEAEYVQIAKKHGKSETRFLAYIDYYRKEDFNIVELEKGRFVDKTEPSDSSSSLAVSSQTASTGEVPTKEEIIKILKDIAPDNKESGEEILKLAIEDFYAAENRKLKPDWWDLIDWSKKR